MSAKARSCRSSLCTSEHRSITPDPPLNSRLYFRSTLPHRVSPGRGVQSSQLRARPPLATSWNPNRCPPPGLFSPPQGSCLAFTLASRTRIHSLLVPSRLLGFQFSTTVWRGRHRVGGIDVAEARFIFGPRTRTDSLVYLCRVLWSLLCLDVESMTTVYFSGMESETMTAMRKFELCGSHQRKLEHVFHT